MVMSGLLVVSLLVSAFPSAANAADIACQSTYTVKSGETLKHIANDFNVTVNRLAKANHLAKPYELTPGQKLCIPGKAVPSAKFTWTPSYNGTQIIISGAGFDDLASFFVKAHATDDKTYEKLFTAVTDDNGKMNVKFKVPQDLRNIPALSICLKDNITNQLTCERVVRT